MYNFVVSKFKYNMSKKEKLFENFPPISTEEWMEKVEKDLKGKDFNKKLVWHTNEGVDFKPFYRQEDLKNINYLKENNDFPFVKEAKEKLNDWNINQNVCITEPDLANKKLHNAIERGAGSIGFYSQSLIGCPYAEAFAKYDKFQILIKDFPFEKALIHYNENNNASAFLSLLDEYAEKNKIDKNVIRGSIAYDPLGYLAITGKFPVDENALFEKSANLVKYADSSLPNIKAITVNGQYYNNAGANSIQELAFSLAQANEYLSGLIEKGIDIDTLANKFVFKFAIGSNYFMEIAKLRAARLLWAKIVEQYNPAKEESKQMFIHAETSKFNKTLYDPYLNMLRNTTEAMSGSIAGADVITVNPFDIPYKMSNDFSDRIARNTQLILKEEAHFDKVVDPSAGSYYIETITDSLIEHSWKLFLEIEEKGGFINAFKDGFIQDKIEKAAQKRAENIAKRKESLVGTNQFPDFQEKVDKDINEEIVISSEKNLKDTVAKPIKQHRLSEEFEKLRIKTDRSEKQPVVFLLTYGNVTFRRARAQFASNFFACAGYSIIDNIGFDTIEEGIKESIEHNADIIVVCSSDEEYESIVPKIHEQLKDKATTVVAGAPKSMDLLKEKGIKYFIHMKSNLLESLKEFNKILNV